MKENLHKIDELFRTHLEHYEEKPLRDTWLAVESNLNKIEADKYKNRYNAIVKTTVCIILLCFSLLLKDIIQKPARNYNKIGVLTTQREKENLSLKEKMADNFIGSRNSNTTNMSFGGDQHFGKQNKEHNFSSSAFNHIQKANNTDRDYEIVSINRNATVDFFGDASQKKTERTASAIRQVGFNPSADNSGNQTKSGIHIKLVKKHNLSLVPFFSYDYLCSRLQEVYKYGNEDERDIAGRENDDMSYTFGLVAEYRIAKKWSLQSGISLSNSFTSISPTVVSAVKDNSGQYKFKLVTTYGLGEITKTGIAFPQNGDSIKVSEASLHVQYITLPILAKYAIKPGKFTFGAIAGCGINRIVNEKMDVDYYTQNNSNAESESIQKIEGMKKAFITGIAGAEATYAVTKNISLGLNPVLRYSFTPVNEGTPIKLYPVNIGLAALVKIKL